MRVGVWEGGQFIGCVLFAWGANRNIGTPYGLRMTEVAELVRVALREHAAPVSRIVAIALRMLRKQSPGLRLLVSYADPEQGHHGGVDQAGGWIYAGASKPQTVAVTPAGTMHKRTAHAKYGHAHGMIRGKMFWKHKYLIPLDDEMRAQVAPLSRPYPKRAGSADSGTPAHQAGGGGATPTPALSD